MAMPAIQLWRKQHPSDHLTILAKKSTASLWRMHPDVNEVIELCPGTRGTFHTGCLLRKHAFDVAYILPNSFRSALIPFWARIPRRRGFARHARTLLLSEIARPSRAPTDYHQSRETAPILLETPPPAILPAPHLEIPAAFQRETLHKFLGDTPSKLLAIIPGAARGDSKRWPHFALAAQRIAQAMPHLRMIVLGTAAEAPLCQAVAESVQGTSIAGSTSLQEFTALLAAASLVLCNDSGGMHLATAVGTPVVAIFGLTDWRRTGPLGETSAVIRRDDITGHRAIARSSRKAARVLASIPPERVASVALYLLQRA